MLTWQAVGKSYSPELKTSAVNATTGLKAKIDGQIDNSEQGSKIAQDVVCCTTNCSPSAMLVGVIAPADRDDRQVGPIVSPAKLFPADYDTIRRPPRTAGEIV